MSRDPKELIITREHAKWRDSGSNYTKEAVERVLEVMSNDMLTSHRESGEGRVRASMLGDVCKRRQQLSFRGFTAGHFSPSTLEIFDTGTFAHYKWQLRGLSAGWLRDIEVPVFTDDHLGGNLDGVMSDGSVFEFKTINPQGFKKVLAEGALPSHVLQAHSYMHALEVDRAHILYEDKSWGTSHHEVVVHSDPETMAHLFLIRDLVAGQHELEPLADCVKATGKIFEYCEWHAVCRPQDWR